MRRFAAAAVVLAVLPFLVSSFRTLELATVGVYFIAILGLDVLAGQSGQISLGHGALMALGAYTTAILVADHGVRDVWTIPVAAVVTGMVGLLAGIPALRIRGLSLAIATFGIAVAVPTLFTKFDHFTGGPTGISFFGSSHQTGRGTGVTIVGHHLGNNEWLYLLTWSIASALFVLAWWLLDGRFGRSLRAVRDSELAAAAAGIDRAASGVAAFGISAAYAGVAGSLLAIDNAYVSPSSFPIDLSLFLIVGATVGLFGSIWGAALGAFLIQFLPDIVGAIPSVDTSKAGPTTFAFGALLVGAMLALPIVVRVGRSYPRWRWPGS